LDIHDSILEGYNCSGGDVCFFIYFSGVSRSVIIVVVVTLVSLFISVVFLIVVSKSKIPALVAFSVSATSCVCRDLRFNNLVFSCL
jgi:hypothetical protein